MQLRNGLSAIPSYLWRAAASLSVRHGQVLAIQSDQPFHMCQSYQVA